MSSTPPQGRILLVDDNVALTANLTEILVDAGYEVRASGSCAESRRLASDGFDVALVDVLLPDGAGTVLAGELKEISPEGEVVLLTGHASVESAVEAVRAGACAYLIKPCPPQELLLTVEQALRQVRLQQEKRELARRAQTAEKLAAVGTLTAGLSHEIRNPLNAASLQLAVLERRIQKLPEASREPLLQPISLVRDEIRRLDHILVDFLQFARPQVLEPKPVSMASLIESIFNLLQGEAERRGLSLQRSSSELPSVRGDEGRLRQAIMNLLLNAMEAIESGGTVRLSSRAVAGMLELAVEDSGPGVPENVRDRIFEPFFTTKQKGSGLGLAIVHAIITQHGGSITVGSSSLGGARFLVTLPLFR